MRSPAAFLGLVALLLITMFWIAGLGGADPRANSGPTKWIVSGILIGIATAWIVAMIVDAMPDASTPHDAAEAEAAAAAHADRRESRRSEMARDRLDRLSALLEQGAITQAEFDTKKEEILRDL